MRVLQVHNFYRTAAPSGEDEVVRAERQLLAEHGIDVIAYERHNDSLPSGLRGAVSAAASHVWSRASRRELANLVARERPAVAHFHNVFPQISVSGYAACAQHGVPIVQTLHNFRLFCANGLMLREGAGCHECLGRLPWPALRHACYRGSRVATAGIALSLAVHRMRRTHARHVSRFIVLTDFARQIFESAGIPADRMSLRGNALASDPGVGDGAGGHALYVGRLTEEKGVATLIAAWRRHAPATLLVVGDGELRTRLEREAHGLPVEFLGYQPLNEVLRLMRAASLLVIPSQCFEGFPRVFGEAMACGTPVLASRIGGLAELLADGRGGCTFQAGDPADLSREVARLYAAPPVLGELRRAARARYESEFSPQGALRSLLDIYAQVTRTPFTRLDPSASSASIPPATLQPPASPPLRR